MKHVSIRAANNLYIGISYGTVHKHKVYHAAFNEFCTSIAKLEYNLGEQVQDDYWKGLLREVKRYRFLLNAAPLSVNSHISTLFPFIEESLRKCHYYFPQSVSQVQDILDKLSILSTLHDNPLLETIAGLVSEHDFTGLLLKESYLFPLVEAELMSHQALKRIELVNQYQLRGTQCYRSLLIVGPSRWYPEYVLRSPRAKEVHLIRYSWLADRWRPSPIFVRPFTQQQLARSSSKSIEDTYIQDLDNQEDTQEYVDQDILPEINWGHIATKILRQAADDSNQEHIPAKLYLLANEQSVFLDGNENAKALVLDLEIDEDDEEELHQVKRILLSKTRPGMFLVLRTEGGGDYIVPIANRILREKAMPLRAMQEQWKALLKESVSARGAFTVSIELLDRGSKRANETNVRNWISSRSIHPQDDEDFRAIMRLIGLQDKEQEYRDAAEQIESAHRKAGFYIRDQLLKQVASADLRELHKKGFLDFELPESDGGSLTAFRLEHVSPEIFSISVSRIGRLTKIKDLSWRE